MRLSTSLTTLMNIVSEEGYMTKSLEGGDYFRFRVCSALDACSNVLVWLKSAEARWSEAGDGGKAATSAMVDALLVAMGPRRIDIDGVSALATAFGRRTQYSPAAIDDWKQYIPEAPGIGVLSVDRLSISREEHTTEDEGMGARESYGFMQSWRDSGDMQRNSGSRGFSRSSFGSERSIVPRSFRNPHIPAMIGEDEFEDDEDYEDEFSGSPGEKDASISSHESVDSVPDLPRVMTDQGISQDSDGISVTSTPSRTRHTGIIDGIRLKVESVDSK